MQLEEQYALRLVELGRKQPRSDGFGQDDSLIANIFSTYKTEMATLASSHQTIVERLAAALTPLQKFVDDTRRLCLPKKDFIDTHAKKLDACLAQLAQLAQSYNEKSALAAAEAKNFENSPEADEMPVMDVMVNMGSRALTVDDFNDFIARMQREVESVDVRSLLGTYKDCYAGDDLAKYIKAKFKMPDDEVMDFLNDLMNNGFIKPVSGRFSHFIPTLQYQWKRMSLEVEHELVHRKAAREAERAEFDYKKAIRTAETTRQLLNTASADYMNIVQSVLLERIRTVKDVLLTCIELEKAPSIAIRSIQDRVIVFLETLEPEKEIQVLVERDRTGVRPVPPILFRAYGSRHSENIFGLSLDALTAQTGFRVPSLLRKCIKYVSDVFEQAANESEKPGITAQTLQLDAWLAPISNLEVAYALRNSLDSGKIRRKVLRKYSPETIVGVIKMYLMELPSSVCSDDSYEPLKLLYLSKSEDVSTMRFNSLRSLLATMSSSHFHTLAFIAAHWRSLVSGLDPKDPKITDFSVALGPYLLRPRVENSVSVHDKHRARLVRDLLVHYDDIISSDILSPTNSAEDIPEDSRLLTKSPVALDSDDESSAEDDADPESANTSIPATYSTASVYSRGDGSRKVSIGSVTSEASKSTGYGFVLGLTAGTGSDRAAAETSGSAAGARGNSGADAAGDASQRSAAC
eukprot:jgi/Hompol1/5023/HPOL_004128-RA